MSGGSSNRHAGTVELRRRQRNGFQASVQYTYAKAIDDAGLGGSSIAQNWLDRQAERALSNFDQRHVLAVQGQYTTGTFTRVGGFWSGWRGKLFREWTLTASLSAGSGTPLTPVILAPGERNGNHRTVEAGRDRRAALCRTERRIPQRRGLRAACGWSNGEMRDGTRSPGRPSSA